MSENKRVVIELTGDNTGLKESLTKAKSDLDRFKSDIKDTIGGDLGEQLASSLDKSFNKGLKTQINGFGANIGNGLGMNIARGLGVISPAMQKNLNTANALLTKNQKDTEKDLKKLRDQVNKDIEKEELAKEKAFKKMKADSKKEQIANAKDVNRALSDLYKGEAKEAKEALKVKEKAQRELEAKNKIARSVEEKEVQALLARELYFVKEAEKNKALALKETNKIKKQELKDAERAAKESAKAELKEIKEANKAMERAERDRMKEVEKLNKEFNANLAAATKRRVAAEKVAQKEMEKAEKDRVRAVELAEKSKQAAAKQTSDMFKTQIGNIKTDFGNMFTGLKKDFANIWSGAKTGLITGAVVGMGVASGVGSTVSDFRDVESAQAFALSFKDWSKSEEDLFSKGIEKLAEKLGVNQVELFKGAQNLFTSGFKGTAQDAVNAVGSAVQYNIAGGKQEDIESSITNLISYLRGEGKTVTDDNIKATGNLLQAVANIAGGNDFLVKKAFSTTSSQTKPAGLKASESGALYATIAGVTGNEEETQTQLVTAAKALFDLTPQMKERMQQIGINKSPAEIIKDVGFKGYLDVLKQTMGKDVNMGKNLKDIEDINKSYDKKIKDKGGYNEYTSTETIDPKTGKYVTYKTLKSKEALKDIEELKKERDEKIKKITDKAEFKEDPFFANLAVLQPNIRGMIPLMHLLTTGMDEYTQKEKELQDVSGTVTEKFDKQTATMNFALDQQTVMLDNFRISLGKALTPAVLEMFKDLNKYLNENKDTLIELAKEGLEKVKDGFKGMIEWLKTNRGEVKKNWDEFKQFLENLKPIGAFIKDTLVPMIKDLVEWFGKLSPMWQRVAVIAYVFSGAISGMLGFVGGLLTLVGGLVGAKGLGGLATVAGGLATGGLAAVFGGGALAALLIYSDKLDKVVSDLTLTTTLNKEKQVLANPNSTVVQKAKATLDASNEALKNFDESYKIKGVDMSVWLTGSKKKIHDETRTGLLSTQVDANDAYLNSLLQSTRNGGKTALTNKENAANIGMERAYGLNKEFKDLTSNESQINNIMKDIVLKDIIKQNDIVQKKMDDKYFVQQVIESYGSQPTIVQNIQGTVVAQDQVNKAANKATGIYKDKNGIGDKVKM